MSEIKSFTLILGVLVITFLAGRLVFAWVEPSQAPPGGNVDAPINVGSTPQTKIGTITVSPGELQAQLFRDVDSGGTWYVNPSGTSVFSGNVGIGINPPVYKLDVAGTVNMTGFRMTTGAALNRVLTSDASGGGTWQAAAAGAPTNATYITQTDNANLTNEQFLSASATGYMKVTTGTGVVTSIATIPATEGGTGQTTYTTGDILYASGATTLSKLSDVATGNAFISGGVSLAPSWGKVGLTTHVSGTLPVSNGGTNATTIGSAGSVAYSTGSAYAFTAVGTAGQVLTSAGSGVPVWGAAGGSLPAGSSGQTLRHDGTSWVANSLLYNNGTNVGIGQTSPGNKLHVGSGWIQFDNGYGIGQEFATVNGLYRPKYCMVRAGSSTYGELNFLSHSWGSAPHFVFRDSSNNDAWMVITGGNVGIGTASPGAKLEIRASGTDPSTNGLYVYNTNNAAGQGAILTARVGGSSAGDPFVSFDIAGEYGWSMGIDNDDSNKFKIGRNWDSISANTALTIQNDGNVGIGTTSPVTKLHVNGSMFVDSNGESQFRDSSTYVLIQPSNTNGNGRIGVYQTGFGFKNLLLNETVVVSGTGNLTVGGSIKIQGLKFTTTQYFDGWLDATGWIPPAGIYMCECDAADCKLWIYVYDSLGGSWGWSGNTFTAGTIVSDGTNVKWTRGGGAYYRCRQVGI